MTRSWPRTNQGVINACKTEGVAVDEYTAGRLSQAISRDGIVHYQGMKLVDMPRFGKFSARRGR